MKYSPGYTAKVQCICIQNPPPIFQRMYIYICLQPCKQGFLAGCIPLLGVDGCHLRGPYPGILLTAIGKDGNNNIFLVAWAVVETDNVDTWTWFLELLVKDLESVAYTITWVHIKGEVEVIDANGADALKDRGRVTYMSDRQKVNK